MKRKKKKTTSRKLIAFKISSTTNGIPPIENNIKIIAYRPPLVVLLKGGNIEMNKLDSFIRSQVKGMIYLGQLMSDSENEPIKVGFIVGYLEDYLLVRTDFDDMVLDSERIKKSIGYLLELIKVSYADGVAFEMCKELGRTVSRYRRSTISEDVKCDLDNFVITEISKFTGNDELLEYISPRKEAGINNVIYLNEVNGYGI